MNVLLLTLLDLVKSVRFTCRRGVFTRFENILGLVDSQNFLYLMCFNYSECLYCLRCPYINRTVILFVKYIQVVLTWNWDGWYCKSFGNWWLIRIEITHYLHHVSNVSVWIICCFFILILQEYPLYTYILHKCFIPHGWWAGCHQIVCCYVTVRAPACLYFGLNMSKLSSLVFKDFSRNGGIMN